MARRRLIREGAEPPAEAELVRALFDTNPAGAVFDREVLIVDATFNFDEFGYYGLSLWLVSEAWPVERVFSEKTKRARRVALFTVASLREQGLGVVPSGKEPHFDTSIGDVYGELFGSVQVTAPSAEQLIDRFLAASYTVQDNPSYEQDPS